ncbi:hypothetical protein [Falsiroseomonas tokyonensis]|uniref:Uncharacterized protein n=1 Tax=Falsiroseomonas tokyonensis TaxID=430521 RepID=A0ABV7BX75_9PROT|nr:hypothetical protein [Falsiroseomonas tokyonensis]MBU8539858.1 hypothetical protein [Falsiroseomonas tokyonensis]
MPSQPEGEASDSGQGPATLDDQALAQVQGGFGISGFQGGGGSKPEDQGVGAAGSSGGATDQQQDFIEEYLETVQELMDKLQDIQQQQQGDTPPITRP